MGGGSSTSRLAKAGTPPTESDSDSWLTVEEVKLLAKESGFTWTEEDTEFLRQDSKHQGLIPKLKAIVLLEERIQQARKNLVEEDRLARVALRQDDEGLAEKHLRRRSHHRRQVDAGYDLRSANNFHDALQRRRAASKTSRSVEDEVSEALIEVRREVAEEAPS